MACQMECKETNVSETKMRQEKLMACLVSYISLIGCWLETAEVIGTFPPWDVGDGNVLKFH